jgi:exodeoxyribonuclease VII large subunit
MEQFALSFALPERRVWSLRELSDGIRGSLERDFANIWISGEISGVKVLPSGHCYFALKDSEAQIKCVCWKLAYWRLKFKPKDGVQVIARGRVDIYELRSEYQFVVEALEPQGAGALQLAFEQLKQKLGAEGLFDAARKRALPRYPRRIGIVTSPQGAVIRDFINILTRRFPGVHIRLFPARVQGTEAAGDVIRGLRFFGQTAWAEVVVLARGGGSIEDLWTFNEESVARAIAASPVPVVSAIGHETDVTIADFVADLRAPTPSAAAELIVIPQRDLLERASSLETRAIRAVRYRLAMFTRRLHDQAIDRAHSLLHRALSRRLQRVDDNEERLRNGIRQQIAARERRRRTIEESLRQFDLRPRLRRDRERLNAAAFRLPSIMQARLNQRRQRFETASAKLSQLNPRLILTRGYAIVMNDAGAILRSADAAPPGSGLRILFADSELRALASPDSPPGKSK